MQDPTSYIPLRSDKSIFQRIFFIFFPLFIIVLTLPLFGFNLSRLVILILGAVWLTAFMLPSTNFLERYASKYISLLTITEKGVLLYIPGIRGYYLTPYHFRLIKFEEIKFISTVDEQTLRVDVLSGKWYSVPKFYRSRKNSRQYVLKYSDHKILLEEWGFENKN